MSKDATAPLTMWKGLSVNDGLVGWQIQFTKPGRRHVGQITGYRNYSDRIVYQLKWTAAHTQRGWVHRKLQMVSLPKTELTLRQDGVYEFAAHGTNHLIPPGHAETVKREEVLEQLTHAERDRQKEERRSEGAANPGPLFKRD